MIKKDKTEVSRMAKLLRVGSGKAIRKLEINQELKPNGVIQLIKLRTGTLGLSQRLVFSKQLPPEYIYKCVCCKLKTRETMEHLILFCSAFKEERKKFLKIKDAEVYGIRFITK